MVESDLSEIPSEVIRAALVETIENKLKSKNCQINVSSASQAGANNFIGVVYRVSFNKEGEESSEHPLKLILKVAPQNEARRSEFFSRPCFLREIHMYNEVLPFLRQFEQSKGVIIEENGFNVYPKCYRTIDTDLNECVLLEDMSVRDFSIIDRYTEEITPDHVRLVMQTLGKLHAISFALKDQQPKQFEKLTSNLSEIFIRRDDERFRGYFNTLIQSVKDAVSGEEDAHLLEKITKFYDRDAIDIAADCLDLNLTGTTYAVISHGDAWQNNTMFRYDNNGKPIEICLLDWQISRYSLPVIDISYYMFCCTTKEVRDAHYDEFLKVYHESLSAHIRRLGSDPEQLYPYNVMMEQFRKFGKFGLILAAALLPMITADGDNKIDLDEMAAEMKNGTQIDSNVFISKKSLTKLNQRLRDVVDDMIRFEYI